MKKYLLTILFLCYLTNVFAFEETNMLVIKKSMSLIGKPIETLKQCAKAGAIPYQNALSFVYLYGTTNTQPSPAEGYAWALAAAFETNKTQDSSAMLAARENLKQIRQRLTAEQITRGDLLGLQYIRDNSKNWPTFPPLTEKFSADCP